MSLIERLFNGRIRRASVWRVVMAWLLAGWIAGVGWAGSDPGRQVLATGWAVLMDPGETLSPAQLADADVMRRFKALEGAPSLGYVRGAAWLRMTRLAGCCPRLSPLRSLVRRRVLGVPIAGPAAWAG